MSVEEIEHYCASIITGSAAWEVPPAPPSTRATTPTPEDESQLLTANDSILRTSMQPRAAHLPTLDIPGPCRNTLIFSASEEENLQDLLTDLEHLPPASPSSASGPSSSEGTDSCDSEEALASWYRIMCKLSSDTRPGSGQTGADVTGKSVPYEPLSPISPFIGGRDPANQSFSTSTPRGPKSMNGAAMDTSMMMDASVIMDTTMIMDTVTMILNESSPDTIRLGANSGAGTGTGPSTGASRSANISRHWSAKIKDRGRADRKSVV